MLNETGEKLLVTVVLAVAAGSFIFLLIFIFRRAIRYGLRGYRVAKKIFLEERIRDQKNVLESNYANLLSSERPSAPQLPSNYLTS